MDQDAFRQTYREVNERACVFEKSVLTNQCDCRHAERFCIAEREGVQCRSEPGHERCVLVLGLLREHARFALRTDQERKVLPHGKAMRVQVGGMRGIHHALHPEQAVPEQVEDVDGVLAEAAGRFGALDDLPYSEIMQQVVAYKGRTRSRRR